MSIFKTPPSFLTVIASAALFLSGCTVNLIDPNAVGDGSASIPASHISAEMPYETQFVEVLGSQMAYVEAGAGDPILFLHGNPTSKYLWRNIMPHLEEHSRVIAPDLIGMGESGKPNIGYTFVEHAEYVQAFIDTMGLENITLVIHDWGSGLGFDYANRNRDNVKAIAFMEAAVAPAFPPKFDNLEPEIQEFLRAIRIEGIGEQIILENNAFVAQFLPSDVRRGLTEEEMSVYLEPYPDPQSRLPTLVWPRQIPFDGGEPADVAERVAAYNEWFLSSDLPKLHLYVSPGAIWSLATVAELQSMNIPNYEAVYVGEGGHFIQEEHPDEIGRNIAHWYYRINQ